MRAGQISCCEQVRERDICASYLLMLDGLMQAGGPGGVCRSAGSHSAAAEHGLWAAQSARTSHPGHTHSGQAVLHAPQQTPGQGFHGLHRQQRLDELHPTIEEVMLRSGLLILLATS